MGRQQMGRKKLLMIWLSSGFIVAAYYNACGKVQFDQSSTGRLNDMQSTAGIQINNNADFTNSALVDVQLSSLQSDEVYVTNDPSCKSGGQWQPKPIHMNWTLGAVNQMTTVYAKFRNTSESLATSCISDSIVHDDQPPLVVLTSPSAFTNVTTPIVDFVASDSLSGLSQQICEWPGQTPAPCNFSTSNGNLVEGRYLVNVHAIDRAGNSSDPVTADLIVDRTPPVITLLAAPSSLGNITAIQFNFNVQDDRSGVKSVECSWENKTSFAACVAPINKTLAEGPHALNIRTVDRAGNSSETTSDFVIDATAPTVRILTGPGDYSNLKTATFTFDGSDSGKPITIFDCRLDTGTWVSNCTTPKSYSALSEMLHTFEVRGHDAAGNLSAIAQRKWFVDVTPPSIQFISQPLALSKNTTAIFKYTISDLGSGLDKSFCSLDGAAFQACPVDGMTVSNLSMGPHKFQVRAIDKASNGADSALINFTVDLKPPTVLFTATPGPVSNLSSFTYQFSATDDYGVDHVECRLDAAVYAVCDSMTTHQLKNLTDGNHKFSVRATDKAGNQGPELSYDWMVDLNAPVISYFQVPPSLVTQGSDVALGFTVTDLGSGVKTLDCKFDQALVACQSGVVVKLPAPLVGNHTFVVVATDGAGNSITDTKSFAVRTAVMKTQQVTVKANNQVDVLVIMDNSGSMKEEMAGMASRFGAFTDELKTLDWQLGIITTDMSGNAPLKDGRLIPMKNLSDTYLLSSKMTPTISQATFASTIQMPTNGSGNELGMKAAMRAFDRSLQTSVESAANKSLIRDGAGLAVVVVSDSYDNSGVKAEDVVAKVKALWPTKAFAWHSVVVPESNYTNANASAVDANDPCAKWRESVKFDGREYHRLSGLTGGIKGNECLDDYSAQLKDMGKVTADLVSSVTLDCQPLDYNLDGKIDVGDVTVTDPKGNNITAFMVQGNKLTFTNQLPIGLNKISYYCTQ